MRARYESITDELLPDGVRALHSEVLGLDIRLEGGRMYFYDVERDEKLLTHEEAQLAELAARLRALEERGPE